MRMKANLNHDEANLKKKWSVYFEERFHR